MNIILADNDLDYHIGFGDKLIISSTCEKYLEVKGSNKLNFNYHIISLRNQASYISIMAATSEIDKSNMYRT